jgi:hypothetical protein
LQPTARENARSGCNGGVMRFSSSMLALLVAGCATSPQQLCEPIVSSGWTYSGPDPVLDEQLEGDLPRTPYYTNENKIVRFVRHVWYRQGEDRILACTFGGWVGDKCSVQVREFERRGAGWSKGAEDMVLCNVVPQ